MRNALNRTITSTTIALSLLALGLLSPSTARCQAKTKFPVFTTAAGSRVPCGRCAAPAHIGSRSEVAPTNEPGERLNISGTIYQADGKTPAQDIVLFLYHTDKTGYYNKEDDAFNPRLRGWVKSDKEGHYKFQTIRPGPYPGRDTPAHIHAHLYGAAIPEHSIEEYRFSDDPRLSAKEREEAKAEGHFSPVVEVIRGSDGIWRGMRDVKLQ